MVIFTIADNLLGVNRIWNFLSFYLETSRIFVQSADEDSLKPPFRFLVITQITLIFRRLRTVKILRALCEPR